MSEAYQIYPSLVVTFNEDVNNLKELSKGTILEPFFTDNSPISSDMTEIVAVNDYIQKNSLADLPDVFVCEKVEKMIQGGVKPFQAMEFGKVLGNNDRMSLFFEMIKPSTMYVIAREDENKILRLFLFGLYKMKVLSPPVLHIVKQMYFEPMNIPCQSKIKKPKNEISELVNYRLGDMENALDEMRKKVSQLTMKITLIESEHSPIIQTNNIHEEQVKIQPKDNPFIFVCKENKTYIKVIDGTLRGNIYYVDYISENISIKMENDQLFITDSEGNSIDKHQLDVSQKIELLWEVIDPIFNNNVEDMNVESKTLNENWKLFDDLLNNI
ncbi:hypothetical protein EHI8A_008590 [Entamoeba histolytica HM-1:IMSS-B]|uniref:Uncharacterized protein n=6 Tax=Entamoeba histolytica TaxID=5759 RepID=C4M7J4_ENTH1|nr:hypothetical protein EHI_170320 [Entamoeba histolytica HM-1:IMSS]EMD48981.1 Hypothetical protein EHI5A_023920 [Entamoeba histolytica KU27]EMH77728.1 hypothetical protein EHI8A_008590 [Entamoeba histolytica HM-1:IMSS-B]EMS14548.1 hypothetical protein KM1_026540 [Entamoeba histolytica HM-3:IMSS]ENY64782.1 hypothetical protein EHI7A_011340 [Entamoeba histolytica HM-1:IMSS-A]GAT97507.1 hypothetical protein CL6EHI_170320 [Entamoeba histolytica]|eukprot:XP_651042.1 hypothetical protein EHI_170320 [Entamoeba histolytica HM-1:IMSS]